MLTIKNNIRPSLGEYWIMIAEAVATRATCPRRSVGAIITSADGKILASGYNGPPNGISHCTAVPCGGESGAPGDFSKCIAVHAEQNAILQLGDRMDKAAVLYTTTFPCFTCAKLICQTGIHTINYLEDYSDQTAAELLHRKGVICLKRDRPEILKS